MATEHQRDGESKHRDSGAALVMGAVVLALLLLGYAYLGR